MHINSRDKTVVVAVMTSTSLQVPQQGEALPFFGTVPQRVHLATFASDHWISALGRIRSECAASGFIDVFRQYTYDDLRADTEFWGKHGAFIERSGRGRGYWIWKPHIILHALSLMDDGEILVYADAGCSIKVSGAERFNKYLEILRTDRNGIFAFSSEHPIYKWTKMSTIKALDGDAIMTMNGVIGTALIIRKCTTSVRIIQQWMDACERYELVDDSPSVLPNHPEFKDHRHDQAILSLILRREGCYTTLDNETWTWPHWDGRMPIWAARAR